MIRVLIAEDSLTVRRYLVDLLESDGGFEVVGEAADGKQAIALCASLRPDVVSMDMMMPLMTGLGATEYIMAHCPTPILIVSASINRGELFRTCDALAAGAVDVVEKPRPGEDPGFWGQQMRDKLRMAARIKVITHLRGKGLRPAAPAAPSSAPPAGAAPRCVLVGASTGGPGAILAVLQGLPAEFDLPLLVVLHLAAPFGEAFSEWLDGQIDRPVRLAWDGMPLPGPGQSVVLLAPPGRHLVLRGSRLVLTDDPPRHACRPSIDLLFESAAAVLGSHAAACLLTGMGTDGAAGLSAIRGAGGWTIAQDEQSCVVYGMPAEAVRIGAACQVLPLERIGPALGALRGAR